MVKYQDLEYLKPLLYRLPGQQVTWNSTKNPHVTWLFKQDIMD